MILNRILRHHPTTREGSAKFFLVLLAFVCFTAVIIRLVQWMIPDSPIPLLLQEDGVIQTSSWEEALAKTDTSIWLPEDVFGNEVFVIGLYLDGTVIAVFTKENWRTGQITFTPNTTLGEERAKYLTTDVDEVMVEEKIAYLFPMHGVLPLCEINVEGFPGVCPFSEVMLFEAGEVVVTIASDGEKMTKGEMIAMARSIASQGAQKNFVDGEGGQ